VLSDGLVAWPRQSCSVVGDGTASREGRAAPWHDGDVTARSIALFVAAALAEIGGAYLVWIGLREHRGALFVALGALSLAIYGVVATFQPSHEFGRVLAAYGGVFIVGSLLWGIAFDDFQPDRADLVGALICLVGVAVIMYAR
jgi:small multidrug resistance family-3 protein